jgi:hypothetical protein
MIVLQGRMVNNSLRVILSIIDDAVKCSVMTQMLCQFPAKD